MKGIWLVAFGSLLLCTCGPGVGEKTDPLVGIWNCTLSDYPTNQQQCTFAANSTWTCQLISDGWPSTWDLIATNTYFFATANGIGCDGDTTFSNNNNTATMALSQCGLAGDTLSCTRVQ